MENLFVKKNPLQDLISSLNAVISTNVRNLTGHVIFKLRYNQIYQMKTTIIVAQNVSHFMSSIQGMLFGDEDVAVIAYHVFKSLTYSMSLFGGFLADTWIGKFNAIMVLAVISLTGSITLTFSTVNPDPNDTTSQRQN